MQSTGPRDIIERAVVEAVVKQGYVCIWHPRKRTVSLNGFPEKPWSAISFRLWELLTAEQWHTLNLLTISLATAKQSQ